MGIYSFYQVWMQAGSSISLFLIRSDQISRSVVSNSLRPHESQHARPPCPSPTPGVHSDSRPSSQWCRPSISSSVVPFSSCSQSLPASESFPMSQLFAWGSQSTGVSALASFFPKKFQGNHIISGGTQVLLCVCVCVCVCVFCPQRQSPLIYCNCEARFCKRRLFKIFCHE